MVYGVILVKIHPVRCLRQKHYRRALFWLKITSATSLLGLASCSQLPTLSSPLDWIKTTALVFMTTFNGFVSGCEKSPEVVKRQEYAGIDFLEDMAEAQAFLWNASFL